MLLVLFDGLCHLVHGDRLNVVPIFEDIEYLVDPWPEIGIGSEQVSHHIFHFLAGIAAAVLDIGIDDAELSLFLEGVEAIVEHE